MDYFKLRAEHMPHTLAASAMTLWEDAGIEAARVWMDPVHTNFVHAILVCSKEQAINAQEIVWDFNNGAECALYPITEQEADEFL